MDLLHRKALEVETMKFVYVSAIINSLQGFAIDKISNQDSKNNRFSLL